MRIKTDRFILKEKVRDSFKTAKRKLDHLKLNHVSRYSKGDSGQITKKPYPSQFKSLIRNLCAKVGKFEKYVDIDSVI